jgi:hypothetical protein
MCLVFRVLDEISPCLSACFLTFLPVSLSICQFIVLRAVDGTLLTPNASLQACLSLCLSACLCLRHSSPLIESYPVYLACPFLRLCPILHALDLTSACLSISLSIHLCLILRAFDYISACLSPCISALDVILPYLFFFFALLMEHQPACLPVCISPSTPLM